MASFVLVHGAFHGGWCWSRVARLLRVDGHTVFTPTQTGLGERRHLLAPGITLDTFIDDVGAVLDTEELHNTVLVGHGFGGIGITGVADRIPERVRHLVYLDSYILEAGQSILDAEPARSGDWTRVAQESDGLAISAPPATYFDCLDPADTVWIKRRLTPYPLRTFTSPFNLANPVIGNDRSCTYMACMDPVHPWLEDCRAWARGRPAWGWAEIVAGHDAMVSAPAGLTALLVRLAA